MDGLTFVSRVVIRGSLEDVWREITRTDRPQPAMFNSRMHTTGLAPGAPIRMRTPDGRFTGVVGEVLEIDPPNRLVHTLKFTAYDDPSSKVTYELKQVDEGVEFTLTSEDIQPGTKTARDMKRGGGFIVKTLKAVVEHGRPPLGTRMLFVMFGLLGAFSPKQTRSEHWPLDDPASESRKPTTTGSVR